MRKNTKNGSAIKNVGFSPVIGGKPVVLILGTFPGKESLEKNQYYGNKQNTFWYIVCKLLNIDLDAGYEEKKEALIKNGIALWDVLKGCEREGSLDSSIKDHTIEINDFNSFFERYQDIKCIYFNGAKAEKEYKKRVLPILNNKNKNIKLNVLPSTSPAMAMLTKEQKFKKWSRIISDIK